MASYTPKKREFEKIAPPEEQAEATPGSLWNSGTESGSLFADQRAFRVNDVVVVRVEEYTRCIPNAENMHASSLRTMNHRAGILPGYPSPNRDRRW